MKQRAGIGGVRRRSVRVPFEAKPHLDQPDPPRITAILNPVAPHFAQAHRALRQAAQQAGWPAPTVLPTTVEQPGASQAARALAEGSDLILVGGGDGTLRQVAAVVAGTGVPVGVIPLGTGDLFARNLALHPAYLHANVATALTGAVADIDLGWASLRHVDCSLTREAFLVMAGIGHDAETVAHTGRRMKKRFGWLAYFGAGTRLILSKPLPMSISIDEEPARSITAWSVLAGNCPNVPAGITVFPQARLDDDHLSIAEVTVERAWQWVPIAAKGVLHTRGEVPRLRYQQARTASITPARPLSVQLDGDVFPDVTRLEVQVQPAALRVKVPQPVQNPQEDQQ